MWAVRKVSGNLFWTLAWRLCIVCDAISEQWMQHRLNAHDDVIKWKHFPHYWPFVREIHRSPVNFPHKGQWRGALMFTLICARMNGWVNNREAGDLRRYRVHYDVIVMLYMRVVCLTCHFPFIIIPIVLHGPLICPNFLNLLHFMRMGIFLKSSFCLSLLLKYWLHV